MPVATRKKLELKPKVHADKEDSENEPDECEESVSNVSDKQNHDSPDEDTSGEPNGVNDVSDSGHVEQEEMPEGVRFNGVVKWFNDRRGYGFITVVTPGEHCDEDIFVHQTHIRPRKSPYRTLVRGEYVSFFMGDADTAFDEEGQEINSSHTHQAIYVTGIEGRELLCDHSFRPNAGRSSNFKGGSNRTRGERSYKRDDEEYSDEEYQPPRRDNRNQYNHDKREQGGQPRRDNRDTRDTRDREPRRETTQEPRGRGNTRPDTRNDSRRDTRPDSRPDNRRPFQQKESSEWRPVSKAK